MNNETAHMLTNDVRSLLVSTYRLPSGADVKGQSMTYLKDSLRGSHGASNLPSGRRWRIGGNFEDTLETLGFSIHSRARNKRGNQATIVYE